MQTFLELAEVFLFDNVLVHGGVKEPCWDTDVDGSFDLVSGENPNLDSSSLHKLYGIGHVLLKSIFNGGRTDQL